MMSWGQSAFKRPTNVKNTALLAVFLVVISSPSLAKPHHLYSEGRHHGYRHASYGGGQHGYHHRDAHEIGGQETGGRETHSRITCEMVRSYVAQVGLAQARAMGQAAGMTASDERRARQCLSGELATR
jgi:hypothetical protein